MLYWHIFVEYIDPTSPSQNSASVSIFGRAIDWVKLHVDLWRQKHESKSNTWERKLCKLGVLGYIFHSHVMFLLLLHGFTSFKLQPLSHRIDNLHSAVFWQRLQQLFPGKKRYEKKNLWEASFEKNF